MWHLSIHPFQALSSLLTLIPLSIECEISQFTPFHDSVFLLAHHLVFDSNIICNSSSDYMVLDSNIICKILNPPLTDIVSLYLVGIKAKEIRDSTPYILMIWLIEEDYSLKSRINWREERVPTKTLGSAHWEILRRLERETKHFFFIMVWKPLSSRCSLKTLDKTQKE